MRGIYAITNVLTDTVYYGQSVNINNRFSKHKSHLKQDKHYNKYLQRSWNKYGESAFVFTPVQLIENLSINLTPIEQKYIDDAYDLGLNVFNLSSPEDPTIISYEGRKKIIATSTGRIPSIETRKKQSEAKKGIVLSEEHKQRIGIAHKNTKHKYNRKPYTVKELKQMSERMKNNKHALGSKGRLGVPQSDTTKFNMSIISKKLWSNPEYRQKQINSHKRKV